MPAGTPLAQAPGLSVQPYHNLHLRRRRPSGGGRLRRGPGHHLHLRRRRQPAATGGLRGGDAHPDGHLHTHIHTDLDAHPHSHRDAHDRTNRYADAHPNTDRNNYTHPDAHTDGDSDGEGVPASGGAQRKHAIVLLEWPPSHSGRSVQSAEFPGSAEADRTRRGPGGTTCVKLREQADKGRTPFGPRAASLSQGRATRGISVYSVLSRSTPKMMGTTV